VENAEVDFVIEVRRGAELLERERASLVACVEDARFREVLRGHIPNDGTAPPVAVAPCFKNGCAPEVEAFELRVADAQGERYDAMDVAAPQARALIRALLAEQRAQSGELLDWSVVARERAHEPAPFRVRASRAPYPLRDAALGDAPARSFRVDIQARVLREIRDAVSSAGTVERAGLLLGFLCHDRGREAAVLRVTHSVPLEAGSRGASELHFSLEPSSFVSAKRAVERSSDGAVPVGWVHSHPPCERCSENRACQAETVFFSAADVDVHASAFASPYMIALVAGKLRDLPADVPGFRLYGWERGRVVELGFTVSGSGNERWTTFVATPRAQRE
jgi:proteasome lid subunit RPN8/RPN11